MKTINHLLMLVAAAIVLGPGSSCTKKEDKGPIEISIAKITDSLKKVPVSFVAIVSKTPDSYSWDFGDGSTSTEISPKHTYQEMGTYNVSCIVKKNEQSYTAGYKLLIKGDGRLLMPRHFSGTYHYHSQFFSPPYFIDISRVITDTVLTFAWTNPFELSVFMDRMLLDHDTGEEVQYQTPRLTHEQQYLRYYPAKDSIYIYFTREEIPGQSAFGYEFVSKK